MPKVVNDVCLDSYSQRVVKIKSTRVIIPLEFSLFNDSSEIFWESLEGSVVD